MNPDLLTILKFNVKYLLKNKCTSTKIATESSHYKINKKGSWMQKMAIFEGSLFRKYLWLINYEAWRAVSIVTTRFSRSFIKLVEDLSFFLREATWLVSFQFFSKNKLRTIKSDLKNTCLFVNNFSYGFGQKSRVGQIDRFARELNVLQSALQSTT